MSTPMTSSLNLAPGLYHCNTLSCIDVYGPDAIAFLQSQFTQDVGLLAKNRAALAGYCSAQGRLLASMIMVPTTQVDRIRLLVRSDLVEGLVKRLRMFVLRSKVTLEHQTQLATYGLALAANAATSEIVLPSVWSVQHKADQIYIRAPSADSETVRHWIISNAANPPNIASIALQSDASAWEAADILAGIPWIQEATRDLFIPQSVNLDLIEGVSFTKGCYPGQEVVARAHYRSKVKRRMHAASITPAQNQVLASVDVHPAGSPEEPCGRIIQVAHTTSSSYVLFEAPDRQIEAGPLSVAQTTNLTLTPIELPYSTRAPE